MSLDELTITLSDKDGRLSVETLKKALENALEMLRQIEAQVVASGVEVRWEIVRATMRSPFRLTVAPRVTRSKSADGKSIGTGRSNQVIARRIVKSALQGVTAIERGKPAPSYFTDAAMEATRKLVNVAKSDSALVSFESKSVPKIQLTEKSIQNIDALASKSRLYLDYSTIEGRLEVVSVHEHNSFFIWETLTNRRIECFVTPELLNQASALLHKRVRVEVSGRVSYRNHVPQSIQVDGPLRVLRDSSELPTPRDIGPINITNGLTSEDHVRRMRNG
jgi:hypothetical protein